MSVPLAASTQQPASPMFVRTEGDPAPEVEQYPDGTVVSAEMRDVALSDDWESGSGIATTTAGYAGGVHVLASRMSDANRRTRIVTRVNGPVADRWIGDERRSSYRKE